VKRTRALIKPNYFWPIMDRDVETYVMQCESCAKFKAGRHPTAPLGELPETTSPFEMASIDICGPYPETKRGNRYLLTFIDHFSRYPETIPIPRQDAPTVARALFQRFFCGWVVHRHCLRIKDPTSYRRFSKKCISC
jgi:hypothetical protein